MAEFGDGNDAIAWAAQDAGVAYVAHYPGSPVNRVVDVLARQPQCATIHINHALNEHIAALAAMGASLCGARSLLVMKHVGLNIAADPLNYAGVIKVKGGMVIVVGTDPGARSSTGEEDVHWYAPQFNFPLFEPASVDAIYQVVQQAFSLSEQVQLPVLVFVPGRLAYQSSLITRSPSRYDAPPFQFLKDPANLINVGARAVKNHRDHVLRLQSVAAMPQRQTGLGQVVGNAAASFGILTRGATFALTHEVLQQLGLLTRVALLNVERTYPLHLPGLLAFFQGKQTVLVVEDQDGFLETMLKRDMFGQVACRIEGKSVFPAWGEVTAQQVREYLLAEFAAVLVETPPAAARPMPLLQLLQAAAAVERAGEGGSKAAKPISIDCPERPGTFCEGCPHRPAFFGIDQALQGEVAAADVVDAAAHGGGIIGGDIGCSSLPPHRTDWLLCMNAGIGLSQGMAQLLPQQSLVSTGGDGSLFHGGLISLLSAVQNQINLTHIILDNRVIAMTGHQASPSASANFDMRMMLQAIGVVHIFAVSAFVPSQLTQAILDAKALPGVKVIWVQGACALQPDLEAQRRLRERSLKIDTARCASCTLCYSSLQCPAIMQSSLTQAISIDMDRCRRCAACLDVCPNDAIIVTDPHYVQPLAAASGDGTW